MLAKLRANLTYANVVSSLSLFIVLGGGAYAAATLPTNSVGTKQLKNNAVTTDKVKNHTLLGIDVKHDSLRGGAIGPNAIGQSELANGAVLPRHEATRPNVRAFGNPGFSVPNAIATRLPFASTPSSFDFDTDNMHDPTGPNPERLTAHTPGIYLVWGNVSWSPNATGARTLRLEHVRAGGGTQDSVISTLPNAGASSGVVQNAMATVRMAAGDYVDLLGSQNSGGALTVFPIWFGASWLGP